MQYQHSLFALFTKLIECIYFQLYTFWLSLPLVSSCLAVLIYKGIILQSLKYELVVYYVNLYTLALWLYILDINIAMVYN